MCKLHTGKPHAWGLWRHRPTRQELGQSWPRCCKVAVFDAIPVFGVAQLARDIYTPGLAGLCPWPGWLPWDRARSRDQLPAANTVLCPVPAVLPSLHPGAAGLGAHIHSPSTIHYTQYRHFIPFLAQAHCPGSSAGSQLRLRGPCGKRTVSPALPNLSCGAAMLGRPQE